jgi:hypothetical protein
MPSDAKAHAAAPMLVDLAGSGAAVWGEPDTPLHFPWVSEAVQASLPGASLAFVVDVASRFQALVPERDWLAQAPSDSRQQAKALQVQDQGGAWARHLDTAAEAACVHPLVRGLLRRVGGLQPHLKARPGKPSPPQVPSRLTPAAGDELARWLRALKAQLDASVKQTQRYEREMACANSGSRRSGSSVPASKNDVVIARQRLASKLHELTTRVEGCIARQAGEASGPDVSAAAQHSTASALEVGQNPVAVAAAATPFLAQCGAAGDGSVAGAPARAGRRVAVQEANRLQPGAR